MITAYKINPYNPRLFCAMKNGCVQLIPTFDFVHFREEGEFNSMTMCDFVIGDRVQDSGDGHRGTVLFVGSVPPTKVWPPTQFSYAAFW